MNRLRSLGCLVLCGLYAITPSASFAQSKQPPGQLQRVLTGLQADGPAWARQSAQWLTERDFVAHLMFMATDQRGGTGGGGWYKPSQSRYGWKWISARFDRDKDDTITPDEFAGPREWFDAFDKDRNGSLGQGDFDWFGDSSLAKASSQVKFLFSQVDDDGNGQITPAEWKSWFETLSAGKDYLSQDDLLPLLMNNRGYGAKGGKGGAKLARPTFDTRLPVICSYISGDVGSLNEGPAVNERAPYFTLNTIDGKGKLSLGDHRGYKPLVLIFGSFT